MATGTRGWRAVASAAVAAVAIAPLATPEAAGQATGAVAKPTGGAVASEGAGDASRRRIDFARVYYKSDAAEKADRAKLFAAVSELEKLKGKVAASPANLLRALTLSDRTQALGARLYIYRHLRYLLDTTDARSAATAAELPARMGPRVAFLERELRDLSAARAQEYLKKEPRLRPYRYALEEARRGAPHALSLKEEELLGALTPLVGGWQGQLHQRLTDRTEWGTVALPDGGGDRDAYRQRASIADSADRAVREEGWRKLHAGYAAHRDLQAFALTRLARARNRLATLRRFPDATAQSLFDLHVRPEEAQKLLDALAAPDAAALPKRHERINEARIARKLGLAKVEPWDLAAPIPGEPKPRFTVDEAVAATRAALAPLGPEYAKELAAVLDPKNGRFDVAAGERNRANLSTGWGFPGSQTSIVFVSNFEGYFGDVSLLAHEAGHAVHFELMGRGGVLPSYANGPGFFTESFGMLNQLLLADHLYRTSADPGRRRYYLGRFLSQAMYPFGIAGDAGLEHEVYRVVKGGEELTADRLDALTAKHKGRFSHWYADAPEMRDRWIEVSHYYNAPNYVVNYLYASLISLACYERLRRDPAAFVPKYVALMKNGHDDTPDALLRRFLGIDVRDPKFVSDALATLDRKLDELERLE